MKSKWTTEIYELTRTDAPWVFKYKGRIWYAQCYETSSGMVRIHTVSGDRVAYVEPTFEVSPTYRIGFRKEQRVDI